MQARQGDVFLESCEKPKGKLAKVDPEGGRVVLAHGEVTGHAHAISARHAALYALAGVMYLKVLQRTQLRHEEHGPIDVEPGFYRVTRQREYSPTEIRRVQD